jgi:hypothetical protein
MNNMIDKYHIMYPLNNLNNGWIYNLSTVYLAKIRIWLKI